METLANTLCLSSQSAAQQELESIVAPLFKNVWLISGTSSFAQDLQLNHDLILLFLKSLKPILILLRKPDLPEQDGLKDLVNLKLPHMCLRMAVAVIPEVLQGRSSSTAKLIIGELLVLGIPPVCCLYHCRSSDTTKACIVSSVSSKRVPRNGLFQSLVSATESATQGLQSLANHMLEEYARDGVHSVFGHYYSTMLLLNVPDLFSTILRDSRASRQHALSAIHKTSLKAAEQECSYKEARMTTSLIHSLLKPARPETFPVMEDFIHLDSNAFRAGIQALLLKSCSEPLYRSADTFLGPDEIASDILLWFAGPSFKFLDAQWRRICMPVWVHIAKRALVPRYQSRPNWQHPSAHLQRNLCRLVACDQLFGIQGTVPYGAAGEGKQLTEKCIWKHPQPLVPLDDV